MTDDAAPENDPENDRERDEVVELWRAADPDGSRAGAIFRATFDQLYDGQHTGRYRWNQLYKTEKTHYGTLLEINLRREFKDVITDGVRLDYRIAGYDIDCKYSQAMGGWMLPPECFGHLLLVGWADDSAGVWSLGVVRASEENRRTSENRDGKTSLNTHGRGQIRWLRQDAPLPPNVLLTLDEATVGRIFACRTGQKRVNELLRLVTNRRIGRNTIATVAQQDDYMKRIRDNGGARSVLRPEGYLIPSGDYRAHTEVARALGAEVPHPGEVVSLPVVPAALGEPHTTELDGHLWRLAQPGEPHEQAAPRLPDTRRAP